MKKTKIKSNKGITLIALILTVVILIIVAVVAINAVSDNGIIGKAKGAKKEYLKSQYYEIIEMAKKAEGLESANKEETAQEFLTNIQEKLKTNEALKEAEYQLTSNSLIVTTKEGYEYTILKDGTLLDEKVMYLDIADGNIDIFIDGYKQYTESLQSYNNKVGMNGYKGKYIITGTTEEFVVRVCDIGDYDITIKDLTIDVSAVDKLCAFNCNRGVKATGLNVTINIEGTNKLCGASASGLGFSKATPNINGETNGSTLTIQGNGMLEAIGSGYSAGIGSGYNGNEAAQGDANNITINSGTIIATGGTHGCGIGGSNSCTNVNNIVINGGNIKAFGGRIWMCNWRE